MKRLFALFALMIALSAFADTYYELRPRNAPVFVTTAIRVFLDEYGIPYDAAIYQTSYSAKADRAALDQALRRGYEPVTGNQGERGPGWRIVYFDNRPY